MHAHRPKKQRQEESKTKRKRGECGDDDDEGEAETDGVTLDDSTLEDLLRQARYILKRKHSPGQTAYSPEEDREFRSAFGIGPIVALAAWKMMMVDVDEPAVVLGEKVGEIKHFLWALMFMKVYSKEKDLCRSVGGLGAKVDPQTLRKWVVPFITGLADLEGEVVSKVTTVYCT